MYWPPSAKYWCSCPLVLTPHGSHKLRYLATDVSAKPWEEILRSYSKLFFQQKISEISYAFFDQWLMVQAVCNTVNVMHVIHVTATYTRTVFCWSKLKSTNQTILRHLKR